MNNFDHHFHSLSKPNCGSQVFVCYRRIKRPPPTFSHQNKGATIILKTSWAEMRLSSPVKPAVHAAGRLPHCWQRVEHLVPTVPARRAGTNSSQTPLSAPLLLEPYPEPSPRRRGVKTSCSDPVPVALFLGGRSSSASCARCDSHVVGPAITFCSSSSSSTT